MLKVRPVILPKGDAHMFDVSPLGGGWPKDTYTGPMFESKVRLLFFFHLVCSPISSHLPSDLKTEPMHCKFLIQELKINI